MSCFRQSAGVQIRDPPVVSVSKKKAPAKAERSKVIELLFEAALLEEAQLKKALQRSKWETNIHQEGGLGDGAGLESEVLDEPKGKSINTSEGSGLKPGVPDVSKADSFKSDYESWGDSDDNDDDDQQGDDERTKTDNDKSAYKNKTDNEEEDEFVHTPNDYVPTDDENIDDEEYDHINEEMYSDVNVELKDIELEGEGKDNKEMTDAGHVDAEHENVNQEVADDQVKDDDQATLTAAPAIQKTKTSPLLTVPILVIPESLTAPATTIPLPIPPFIPIPQQSTPIPTSTTTEATTFTPVVPESETLTAIHQKVSDLKKEVKILKDINHDPTILAAVKFEVSSTVKEYLGTSLDDALHKVLQTHSAEFIKEHSIPADVVEELKQQQKPQTSAEDIRKIKMEHAAKQQESQYTIKSSDKVALKEFDQKRALFKTMTASKTFNINPKHKALYHALMESILADKDVMDKGVTEIQKKRKPDDADRDENHPAGPYQSAQAEEIVFETADTQVPQNPEEDMGNTFEQPNVEAALKQDCDLNDQLDWNNPEGDRYPFDLSKPLPLIESRGRQIIPADYFFNNDLVYLQGESTDMKHTTLITKIKVAKYELSEIEDIVPTLWSPIKVTYDKHVALVTSHQGPKRQRFYGYATDRVSKHDVYSRKRILAVTNVKVNKWYGYGHLEEIKVQRYNQKLLNNLDGEVIVHFAVALRMFTRRIIIQKRVEDL
ncbi:hypothetical protein Tco_0415550 [Tanacetum coccineum]